MSCDCNVTCLFIITKKKIKEKENKNCPCPKCLITSTTIRHVTRKVAAMEGRLVCFGDDFTMGM